MRRRPTYKYEAGDALDVAAVRLERDLHAHRMSEEDCAIDLRVVENGCDVVGEILDAHARGITRRSRAAVSSIMRMQSKPIGQVLAQVAPDVAVTPDAVA